jgi:hypothetical protein
MLHDLKRYVPIVYNGIQEMDNIINTEQQEIDTLYGEMKLAYNRQTVINADEKGISLYEAILNINSDSSAEGLEFRKQKVILQLTTAPPFSFNFLLQQLDKIAGRVNYKAWIDFNNYTLYIQSETSNKLWFNELTLLLARIKPANILYVYIGYNKTNIGVKSETSYKVSEWKYKLNGTWRLGEYAFYVDGEETKMGTNNVKDFTLNKVTEYVKSIVDNVYINDSEVCSKDNFSLFDVSDNLLQIEFIYPLVAKATTKEITNLKIRDASNNVLIEKDLYIAVDENVTVHLDINILEVLS